MFFFFSNDDRVSRLRFTGPVEFVHVHRSSESTVHRVLNDARETWSKVKYGQKKRRVYTTRVVTCKVDRARWNFPGAGTRAQAVLESISFLEKRFFVGTRRARRFRSLSTIITAGECDDGDDESRRHAHNIIIIIIILLSTRSTHIRDRTT